MRGAAGLLVAAALSALPVALSAGEAIVSEISEKHEPLAGMPKDAEKRLIEMYGEQQGRAMWTAMQSQAGTQQYVLTIANTDKVRRVVRVELHLEFLDGRNQTIGQGSSSHEVSIDPDETETVRVECGDPLCRRSERLWAKVQRADYVELGYGAKDEIVFGWKKRRWFLENRWDTDETVILRTFSRTAYTDKGFDGRVFPPGKLEADKGRYYRVAKEEVPGGFAEDSVAYEVDAYATQLLPGFKVERGQKKKVGFFESVTISNTDIQGTITVGEYVQIREAARDTKNIDLVIGAVCQLRPKHRWLRGRVRFALGKNVMKGPDYEAIDRAIREWLEPVSIGEVGRTCGPVSGTMVRRWDVTTTPEDVQAHLGPADARVETPGGDILVFGDLKLRFAGGRLAGVEKRPSP